MKRFIFIKKQNFIKCLYMAILCGLMLSIKGINAFASPENPVIDSKSGTTQWDYVYFGSYPQIEITDESTIDAIETAIEEGGSQADSSEETSSESGEKTENTSVESTSTESSNTENTSTGISVWVDGIKYSRIQEGDAANTNNFGTQQTYRYFKWQRIKWKVLKNDDDTLFLIADQALDCKAYHETKQDITWESSTLRSWLNGSHSEETQESADSGADNFYDIAFSKEEQAAIVQTEISNPNNSRYSTAGGNATTDYIYLLSIEDVSNGEYGFSNDSAAALASCQTKASDFAYRKGVTRSISTGKEGNCSWWLRSPGMYGYDAGYVNYSGYVNPVGLLVTYNDIGICPALGIQFTSDEWDVTDDGTSGDGGAAKTLTGLTASKTKTIYTQGETLQMDDLTVTVSYSHISGDIQKVLSENAYTTNADTLDMNTPGTKTLTVSYTKGDVTKTATILLTVNEKVDLNSENTTPEQEKDSQNETNNTSPKQEQNSVVEVEKLTIKSPSKKLAAGKKVQLTAAVTPANATNKEVTWQTSNKKYATINKKGILTLKKAGIGKKVTVTATAKDGSGKKASIKIKIMKDAVKSIQVTASEKTLKAGKSMTIKAKVKTTGKSVNKSLAWKSSNTKYATINKKGKVTAKKAGRGKTVTITATSTDGSNKKASVKIKIK